MNINTEFPTNSSFVTISILSLIFIYKIPPARADEAITMFQLTLVESGVYERYKHLNRYYYVYTHNDWLTLISTRYRKEEWFELKRWLLVVIFDIAKNEGHPPSFVNKLLGAKGDNEGK